MGLTSVIYRFFKILEKVLNYSSSKYFSNRFSKCGTNFKTYFNIQFHNENFMEMGNNVLLGRNCRIECINYYQGETYHPKLLIGNNVVLNDNVHIGCANLIEIEDYVLMGSNIYISDHNHGTFEGDFNINIPFVQQPLTKKKSVKIGKNSWIGDGCFILPGVSIGENCVIAANSVVTKNIPNNSICAGSPAKIIKSYNVEENKWNVVKGTMN